MGGIRLVPIGLVLALLTALVPAAQADHTPLCTDVTANATEAGPAYVRVNGDQVEIWRETNMVAGLQTEACTTVDGQHAPADTLETQMPADAFAVVDDIVALVESVVGLILDIARSVIELVEAICSAIFGQCKIV